MALPQAIQQQSEQAEALHAQIYGQESEPVAETAPPVEPVAEAEVEQPTNVVELPKQAKSVQAEAPKSAEPTEAEKYWKHRFDTVQGILNAEMPRLHAQLKEQAAQIQKLQERPVEEDPRNDDARDVKDVEDYGADLIDMVNRKAETIVRKVLAQEIAAFRKEIGAVQEQVGQVSNHVAQSAEERFWGEVMTLVPDWRQVDSDPSWIQWLDTTPEFAEDTYRELASKAIAKGDAQKVAKLVALWKGPQAVPTPQPQPDPQAELRRQVAPSSTKSNQPTLPAGKIWTRQEYEAAMDVRNVQRLGPKEAERLEADANKAVAEGRVRW